MFLYFHAEQGRRLNARAIGAIMRELLDLLLDLDVSSIHVPNPYSPIQIVFGYDVTGDQLETARDRLTGQGWTILTIGASTDDVTSTDPQVVFSARLVADAAAR